MESDKSLVVRVDNEIIDTDINDVERITTDYNLEDIKEFQVKRSSEALMLKFPGTLHNQRIFKTKHNVSVESPENAEIHKFSVEINGEDIFIGKCILNKVHLRGNTSLYFEVNAFGNNADWILILKESSLYDVIKTFPNHPNNYESVQKTWNFPYNYTSDGKFIPYVFAPVKYNLPIDEGYGDPYNEFSGKEGSFSMLNMKPSISIKWLLKQSFRRAGFSIQSNFLNIEYFRRLVMPWTFGYFLTTEGSKYDVHKFLAVGRDKIDFSDRTSQKEDFLYSNPRFTVKEEENQEAFEKNPNSFISRTGYINNRKVEYFGFEYKSNFDFGELTLNFEFDIEYKYHKSKIYEIVLFYEIERNNGLKDYKNEIIFSYRGGHNSSELTTNIEYTRPIKMNAGDKVLFWVSMQVRRANGNIMLLRYLNLKYFKLKSITIPKDAMQL